MIRNVGIIVQGQNDEGFLLGMRDRMGCRAALVPAKSRGKNKLSVRRQAKQITRDLERQGVDLIIRLTDSDTDRWQMVKRDELQRFPSDSRSMLVCGVTERTIEHWLATDRKYLEEEFAIRADESIGADELATRVKRAITARCEGRRYSEVVRNLVANAKPEVFRRWLERPSLRDFYEQCRDAATRAGDCPVNDELRH